MIMLTHKSKITYSCLAKLCSPLLEIIVNAEVAAKRCYKRGSGRLKISIHAGFRISKIRITSGFASPKICSASLHKKMRHRSNSSRAVEKANICLSLEPSGFAGVVYIITKLG